MSSTVDHQEDGSGLSLRPQGSNIYAFLNHSPATLPNNLPPSVDDKPLARQRRRRTSPEDQVILEAAYARDPKPDKAARLQLVQEVALGEKEVQIWFQNRRQTSRRKSRPLLPHEVAQYQLARNTSFGVLDLARESRQQVDHIVKSPGGSDNSPTSSLRSPSGNASTFSQPTHDGTPDGAQSQQTTAMEPEKRSSIGYLANRRRASSFLHNDAACGEVDGPQPMRKDSVHADLTRSSSFVRLSMTTDGKASITTKDAASPSPPRLNTSLPPSAYGCTVTATSTSDMSHSRSSENLLRSSSGRSRDSRTWEFWCDREARYDLQDKAQKDASGSAADAIGLLRSTSGRTVLGVIPSKRNSIMLNQLPMSKRRKGDHAAKGGLYRSKTSLGRLEGKVPFDEKFAEGTIASCSPGNDSDKENWSPDEGKSGEGHLLRRAATSGTLHRGNNRSTAPGSGLIAKEESRSARRLSTNDPEADQELATFMRGGSKANGNSEEEDMDCVQGLLSLSQGNWR